VTISTKLGVASVLLLASVFVPPYTDWRGPINFAATGISFVLALLAAHRGAKSWLAVPALRVLVGAIAFYATMNAN
jgi:hypothetical protein